MEAYQELEKLYERVYRLSHLASLGFWDARTKMPSKGAEARGNALAEIQQLMHDLIAAPTTAALLDKAEAAKEQLNSTQQANLREMRLKYVNDASLPDDFVTRKVRAVTASRAAWPACKASNDFASFLPHLQRNVDVAREEARHRSAATGRGLYESLLAMYEPGMSLSTVTRIFDEVKAWLPALYKEILDNTKDEGASIIPVETPVPVEKQAALGHHLMKVWGFDFERGRIDDSVHPFTGMTKEDSRITVNYSTESYTNALFAIVHETGHSNYATHCGPEGTTGQPVGEARSMTIHESQSRFAEVIVGCGGAFAAYITPYLKEYLGDQPAFTEENVRRIHQRVQPNHIRIRADEVSYPLHILIRFEIEKDLIEGVMEAADVPRVWAEKMKAYMDLDTTGRDDIGCMQDIHWAQAAFGYFPTYSLGSIFAAQLMATITRRLGEEKVQECIRTGHLQPIAAIQEELIWSQGCLYETEDLIQKSTGEPLTSKYFRAHLERRYLRRED